jgi:hypothetical protein
MRAPSFSLHLLRRLTVATACLVLVGMSASAAEPLPGLTPHSIEAPHYGDTLFHFYQGDHFTAITSLMASQHVARLTPHDHEAELLRGGMLLSYGLHTQAGDIFNRLIGDDTPLAVRDRAWFYLARMRHQTGHLPEAEAALARITTGLPPALQAERGLLQANLLMARGDHAGAAKLLQAMADQARQQPEAPDASYVRFNLGVAQIRSNEAKAGQATLGQIGLTQAQNEEQRALRDRANVALGFAALAAQQPEAARTHLARVRLQGADANKALLGLGWAADAMNAPQQALAPWLELAGRDLSDPAALEARIAVPHAYAELGAYGQALSRYQGAIAEFDVARFQLDASIAAIRAGRFIDELLALSPEQAMGQGWHVDALPSLPHVQPLAPLMAQHAFQEGLRNLRDLRFLQANLQAWRDKLDSFQNMLDTRRLAFAERLGQLRQRDRSTGITALQAQRAALAVTVAQAEADGDGVALADARQRGLLARVARVQALTSTPDAAPDVVLARDRVRLVAGALSWQLSEDANARLWSVRSGLQAIDEGLARAQRQANDLAQAQQDEPERLDRFGARIQALKPLLDVLSPRVQALSQAQQVALQDLAVAELNRQQAQLDAYTVQARFAVAQLYDRIRAQPLAAVGAAAVATQAPVRPTVPAASPQGAAHAPQP